MTACSAVGCRNRDIPSIREKGITFHRFPWTSEDRFRCWVANVGRRTWVPNKRSRLCSEHFTPENFDRTRPTARLRSDSIPTIFNTPLIQQDVPQNASERAFGASVCSNACSLHDDKKTGCGSDEDCKDHLLSGDYGWQECCNGAQTSNMATVEIKCKAITPIHPQMTRRPSQNRTRDRLCRYIYLDHNYYITKSPMALKVQINTLMGSLEECKQKLVLEQKRTKRLRFKVNSLQSTLNQLQNR